MKIQKRTGFRTSVSIAVFFLFALGLSSASAADFVDTLTGHFQKKIPLARVDTGMTMDQAMKVQQRFVANLIKEYGEPVGYKAGLTNPVVQKMLGVSEPVRGTILAKMILKSGAEVSAAFGSVPMVEGDLCVRVSGDAINQAKTPEDVLKYLDAVIPAMELADLVFAREVKLTGPIIAAINVGPRYFVLGDAIPLSATKEWQERLGNFTMNLNDQTGAMLAEGKAGALLGHPLKVVLWIRDSLAAEGKALKKGDILSLGSVTKMVPPKAGTVIKGRYTGLSPEGPVEISVSLK